MTDKIHYERSSYREMLIEHLLAGELMRHFWRRGSDLLEMAKPQVDDGGYDLILQANGVIRHVQLKSSLRGSKLRETNVSLSLEKKPSACVIVVRFSPETLEIGPFHFFGGSPGQPLPEISELRIAKNTRSNSSGVKQERIAHRCVPLSRFARIATIPELAGRLFGDQGA